MYIRYLKTLNTDEGVTTIDANPWIYVDAQDVSMMVEILDIMLKLGCITVCYYDEVKDYIMGGEVGWVSDGYENYYNYAMSIDDEFVFQFLFMPDKDDYDDTVIYMGEGPIRMLLAGSKF
jgi:hypothetical protein